MNTHDIKEQYKTEIITGDTIYSKLETITKTVHNIPPLYRRLSCLYMLIILFGYIFSSYNDGKHALFEHRTKVTGFNRNSEWIAIKKEISMKSWENFLDSVVFPYTMFSHIVPNAIMYFNPVE